VHVKRLRIILAVGLFLADSASLYCDKQLLLPCFSLLSCMYIKFFKCATEVLRICYWCLQVQKVGIW